MKSAEITPSPTRPRMPSVPKYLRLMPGSPTDVSSCDRIRVVDWLRLPHHQRQQVRDAVAQLSAVADLVDRAVLDQEFAALEAFGQGLAHGLLDHPWPRETDQCLRLGGVDVRHHCQRRGC